MSWDVHTQRSKLCQHISAVRLRQTMSMRVNRAKDLSY